MPQTLSVPGRSAIRLVELLELPLVPQLRVLKHSVPSEFALKVLAQSHPPARTKTSARLSLKTLLVELIAPKLIAVPALITPNVLRIPSALKPPATHKDARQSPVLHHQPVKVWALV